MGLKKLPNAAGSFSSPTNHQYTYGKELYGWPQSFELPCYDKIGFEDPLNDWLPTDFVSDVGLDYGNQYQSDLGSPMSGYGSGIDTSPLPSWSSIQNSPSPSNSVEPISPPTSPQHQVCRVCNDVATGNHFGVLSCEACKSFFRRSIRAGARYVCRGSKCCDIDKNTRNRCQHCRLQKCLDTGMNRNGKEFDEFYLEKFYVVFPIQLFKKKECLTQLKDAGCHRSAVPAQHKKVQLLQGIPGFHFHFMPLVQLPFTW